MKLSIDSLRETGGFSGGLVEKEIEWECRGKSLKATVYVRPLSYHSAVSDIQALHGAHDAAAGRIAASICDEQGRPVFTPELITGYHADGSPVLLCDEDGEPIPELDASGNPVTGDDGETVYQHHGSLDGDLTLALLTVIAEVNGLGKTKAPMSRRKRKSGTSSSSPASAGARSPKPSSG